jgi:hypothetical protein
MTAILPLTRTVIDYKGENANADIVLDRVRYGTGTYIFIFPVFRYRYQYRYDIYSALQGY